MKSFELNPKFHPSTLNDQLVAGYLVFRQGLHVHDSHCFHNEAGDTLVIDVDEDDIPIAMEYVHLQSPVTKERARQALDAAPENAAEEAAFGLFMSAVQMIAIKQTHSYDAITRACPPLLNGTTSRIKALGANQLALA